MSGSSSQTQLQTIPPSRLWSNLIGIDSSSQQLASVSPTTPHAFGNEFRSLPPDVLTAVFNYLPKDVSGRLAQVCKEWRAPAEARLWKEANYGDLSRLVAPPFPPASSPLKSELAIENGAPTANPSTLRDEDEHWMAAFTSGSGPESTAAIAVPVPLDVGLERLTRLGPNVRRLTVRLTTENAFEPFGSVGCWVVMQSCRHLQQLRIFRTGGNSATRAMDSQAILMVLRSAPPSLSSLHLKVKHLSDQALLAISEVVSASLVELNLNCASVSEAGIVCALACMRGVRRLIVTGDWIGVKSMTAMGRMPNLNELFMFTRAGVSPEWILGLPRGCFEKLKLLAFDGAEGDDLWTKALCRLAKENLKVLESLMIGGSSILSATSLLALAKGCGATLKSCVFHECQADVTKDVIAQAARSLRNLEKLQLGEPIGLECAWVSPALGVALSKFCPRLRSVDFGNADVTKGISEVMAACREILY
ncbi:hypothetical protein HK101_004853 [Irineochytrium annulatum]|nr:hypothetical protein HK101_004853 [Irineochytrium annulatum]